MDPERAQDICILSPRNMSFTEFLENFKTESSSDLAAGLPSYLEVESHVLMSPPSFTAPGTRSGE